MNVSRSGFLALAGYSRFNGFNILFASKQLIHWTKDLIFLPMFSLAVTNWGEDYQWGDPLFDAEVEGISSQYLERGGNVFYIFDIMWTSPPAVPSSELNQVHNPEVLQWFPRPKPVSCHLRAVKPRKLTSVSVGSKRARLFFRIHLTQQSAVNSMLGEVNSK